LIRGIGTDILEVRRISEMSRKMGEALAQQVLGPDELAVYRGLVEEGKLADNYLARRFAAKEAFVKASGIDGLDVREVQVLNLPNGAPFVELSGTAQRISALQKWHNHVTITDSDSHVVATVICEVMK
jgi:holo-[acyl-carrier protein] synthase